MKRKLVMFISITVAIVLCVAYWASLDRISLDQDDQKSKPAILSRIPVGSSIVEAKRTLENNSFSCGMHQNDAFGDYDPRTGKLLIYTGKNFLYCGKEKSAWLFRTQPWQVAIPH